MKVKHYKAGVRAQVITTVTTLITQSSPTSHYTLITQSSLTSHSHYTFISSSTYNTAVTPQPHQLPKVTTPVTAQGKGNVTHHINYKSLHIISHQLPRLSTHYIYTDTILIPNTGSISQYLNCQDTVIYISWVTTQSITTPDTVITQSSHHRRTSPGTGYGGMAAVSIQQGTHCSSVKVFCLCR